MPPLTDEQRKLAGIVGATVEQTRRRFEQSAQEVEFRKWCVTEAVKICSAHGGGDLPALTQFIYGFCHEPMTEFLKTHQLGS